MKYLLLIHASALEDNGSPAGCEPADWMAYEKEVRDAGVYVTGESLADLVTATTVKIGADGQRSITTDGPFAETRELLGGFYVLDVPDLDAALDWAARCPGARDGAVVVRPIAEFPG